MSERSDAAILLMLEHYKKMTKWLIISLIVTVVTLCGCIVAINMQWINYVNSFEVIESYDVYQDGAGLNNNADNGSSITNNIGTN